jgi:hypothetical protein
MYYSAGTVTLLHCLYSPFVTSVLLLYRDDLPAWMWCSYSTDMTFLLDSIASSLLT